MSIKKSEEIIEGLSKLLKGFGELGSSLVDDLHATEDDDEEFTAAQVAELRAAIETVIDQEDYAVEDLADLISLLTEALEDIDPDVFNEDTEFEEDSDADDSDDLYDDLEEDYDEYE